MSSKPVSAACLLLAVYCCLLPAAAACCLLPLIEQLTVSDRQLILLKSLYVSDSACVLLGKWRLIYLGTILWVLVANEVVSLDVSDMWAILEEFGVFRKRIAFFSPVK